MKSSMHWDHTIAESRTDEAQLKRDMRHHPRTTGKSMRELARMTATQGSLHVTHSLDMAFEWLSQHRGELPSEIEDDNGSRPSSQRLEVSGSDYRQLADDTSEVDIENGLFDVGQGSRGCYLPLEVVAKRNRADGKLLATCGLVLPVWVHLMGNRGDLYMKYATQRGKWLRWRGMRWAVAYENTVAILNRTGRTKMDVLSLPDNLSDLFDLDEDVLRWKVARGRAAVGSVASRKQIRIDGVDYSRSRIIKYLRTGWVSDYRKVTGTKSLREDGNIDIRLQLGTKSYTIMECHSEQEADQALWAVRWAVGNFQ